ncbi:hypothetical protein BOTBODRAFT_60713 [Botryobasidium botryosum FD-172 SS1]|uniref:SEC7 domain-containing protein n=1 Tax=Botryobasidium botryosum (strain FD-172 SS1) TaxID=930990 RepID=A0A067M2W2_BOTB1|nr:hypothetical protein BOTBODRAFT_60713 [Botryobasidium botryosum FD-172 SS1]
MLPKVVPPEPKVDEETPEAWLERLSEVVSKANIAGVLASSTDSFYSRALQAYISRFDFTTDPLDVALRKLLMDLSLPRETQQIDRVMEAFAKRYESCNPGLFVSQDHPYILAFSLMMLHTDAFNKSNKNKMTKADYIKNTRLPGIPSEVLDCFFDNITFAPFIFIEDDLNAGVLSDSSADNVSNPAGGGSTLLGKPKIDPYFLIAQKLLDPLRAEVESHIPTRNPFRFTGPAGMWNEQELQRAFATAESIEIHEPTRRKSAPLPSFPESDEEADHRGKTVKVTKIGVLSRKEDLAEGGRKASSRKWKDWSVILTGSQLLFLKDTAWAGMLLGDETASVNFSQFKPDEWVSIKDAIALYDLTYDKYPNAFRLVLSNGRQLLLKALDDTDLGEWMSRINYVSAFKSHNVRMRPTGMTGHQAMSAGAAAAKSHFNDLKRDNNRLGPCFPSTASPSPPGLATEFLAEFPRSPSAPITSHTTSSKKLHAMLNGVSHSIDLETPGPSDGGLEDTFNEIKAELAARSGAGMMRSHGIRAVSLGSNASSVHKVKLVTKESQRQHGADSRGDVIRSLIGDLDMKIATLQAALEADFRLARNLAVLTPFQRSTRERVQAAVAPVARRVRKLRMDLAKLVCHRDVLKADLSASEKERQLIREVAMLAATNELRMRKNSTNVPGAAGSIHSGKGDGISSPAKSVPGSAHERPQSSSTAFYSAASSPEATNLALPLEEETNASGRDSGSNDLLRASTEDAPGDRDQSPISNQSSLSLGAPSSVPSGRPSLEAPTPSSAVSTSELATPARNSSTGSNESEQAEEWNKTRAAKRVSLVTVPSNLHRLSSRAWFTYA